MEETAYKTGNAQSAKPYENRVEAEQSLNLANDRVLFQFREITSP